MNKELCRPVRQKTREYRVYCGLFCAAGRQKNRQPVFNVCENRFRYPPFGYFHIFQTGPAIRDRNRLHFLTSSATIETASSPETNPPPGKRKLKGSLHPSPKLNHRPVKTF